MARLNYNFHIRLNRAGGETPDVLALVTSGQGGRVTLRSSASKKKTDK